MVQAEVRLCPDCKRLHIGGRCGLTFRERIRTVNLDPSATPNRLGAYRPYYDPEPIKDIFGADAREEALEETQGYGPGRVIDGRVHHRDRHTGEWNALDDETANSVYLAGEETEDTIVG